MKEKIALIGGRGMLGSDLNFRLGDAGYAVTILDVPEFDLTRAEMIESGLAGADLVVNCAAYTNVDQAERQSELVMKINADAVGLLGQWAARRKVHVIHISTDFIFDGKSDRPYVETDRPNPINVYGRSKLMGEEALQKSGCKWTILRIEWSYGRQGANFIAKFLERAGREREMKVVADQVGAPTWTVDIAGAILRLARARREGIFHFAASGYASRFEVASFVARKKGLSNTLVSCSSSDYPARALRPLNSRFCTDKIQQALDFKIRSWQDALSEYLG